MKQLLGMALCALGIFFVGWLVGFGTANSNHAGDYSHGYAAGVHAASLPTPEQKVVGNMLCHYATLACGGGK